MRWLRLPAGIAVSLAPGLAHCWWLPTAPGSPPAGTPATRAQIAAVAAAQPNPPVRDGALVSETAIQERAIVDHAGQTPGLGYAGPR